MKPYLSVLNRAAVILAMVTLVWCGCTRKTTSDQAATPAAGQDTAPSLGDRVRGTTPDTAAAPYDLRFIDTMSDHHQGAVMMARMAVEKASHPELKSFAEKIITDQEKEIAQMKEWRDQWFPGNPVAVQEGMPGMMESMQGMDTHMEHMRSMTGPEFDSMFLDMMIPHHQGAITMSQDALTRADHQELKDLARRIIDAQQKEIETMNRWKSEWSSAG